MEWSISTGYTSMKPWNTQRNYSQPYSRTTKLSASSSVCLLKGALTCFPECALPINSPCLAWLGGSHALWHIFIGRAISLHSTSLLSLKGGVTVCRVALPVSVPYSRSRDASTYLIHHIHRYDISL
ncbi:hypothetical protein V8E52_005982 [Russula decolorans]